MQSFSLSRSAIFLEKEFIFEYEAKYAKVLSSPGQSLVGSPNLTESGFITNQELATLHTDKEFFNEAKQDFIDAWEDSIPLIENREEDLFIDPTTTSKGGRVF